MRRDHGTVDAGLLRDDDDAMMVTNLMNTDDTAAPVHAFGWVPTSDLRLASPALCDGLSFAAAGGPVPSEL